MLNGNARTRRNSFLSRLTSWAPLCIPTDMATSRRMRLLVVKALICYHDDDDDDDDPPIAQCRRCPHVGIALWLWISSALSSNSCTIIRRSSRARSKYWRYASNSIKCNFEKTYFYARTIIMLASAHAWNAQPAMGNRHFTRFNLAMHWKCLIFALRQGLCKT